MCPNDSFENKLLYSVLLLNRKEKKMLISKYLTSDTDMEKEVAAFEEKFRMALPEPYRKFLIRYNGGETPNTSFKINHEDSDVRAFYGIGDVEYSFDKILEFDVYLKRGLLPIARDFFGNYVAIGISADESGKIFFLDHEKNMKAKLLTDTFEEFVKKCKSKKIAEERTRSIEERERSMIEAGNEMRITDGLRKIWAEEIRKYGGMKQERVVLK